MCDQRSRLRSNHSPPALGGATDQRRYLPITLPITHHHFAWRSRRCLTRTRRCCLVLPRTELHSKRATSCSTTKTRRLSPLTVKALLQTSSAAGALRIPPIMDRPGAPTSLPTLKLAALTQMRPASRRAAPFLRSAAYPTSSTATRCAACV